MTIATDVKDIKAMTLANTKAIADLASTISGNAPGDNSAVLAAIGDLKATLDTVGANVSDIENQVTAPEPAPEAAPEPAAE